MQPRPDRSETTFLLLAGLFLAALVVCNLVANKFVSLDLGFVRFDTLSVGILPYPVTFLVTDIISEMYGRRRANSVVLVGFIASLFVLGVLLVGGALAAKPDTGVDDSAFNAVFGKSWRVVAASMSAYLAAQYLDVRLFHFWRRLTGGRHLWLRNNASTIFSQLIDTTLVVTVLFYGEWGAEKITGAVLDAWKFKLLCALADTPLIYLAVWAFRRWVPEQAAAADGD